MKAALIAVVAALAGAATAVAAAPTSAPGVLVVALSLPAPGFQVGAVDGPEVVYARGFEVELARALARRLHVPQVRFVNVADSRRLVSPGSRPWDIALARILPSPRRRAAVDLVGPYLVADQVVLLRRGLARPRTLPELSSLRLCAVRGMPGAGAVAARVRPSHRALLAGTEADLLRWLQTGRCDAAVADAATIGAALKRRRSQFGEAAGRVGAGAGFAIALGKGSALTPEVDRALRGLRTDGTIDRLARTWLGIAPSRLRALG